MPVKHTDQAYESELQSLRDMILVMAGQVEQMIANAVQSMVERDSELARRTIEMDHKVNRTEVAIDALCLLILAKRQPVASDLRFVTLALKMVTDLERIGDVAVNICERSIELNQHPPLKPYQDIPAMAEIVRAMVRDAIDAFIEGDVDKAQRVLVRDDEVDELYHRVFRDLLEVMRQDLTALDRALWLQAVAKFLERVGDHATNLAEQVIFLVRGMDVRHKGKR